MDNNEPRRVIALGFFDGVHVGHGALLRRVGEAAAETGAVPSACTFDTHPENLILKSPTPLLSAPSDRADLMRRYYQIQDVIIAHFDERMMRMPWRDFVTEFLVSEHGAVHLVAGHDFHFGYKGEGNPERLLDLCREMGLGCDIVPKVEQDHITVSSTYIRTLVAQGELERAGYFLGHPHTLGAEVDARRRVGLSGALPTVFLRFHPGVLLPAPGVYACRLRDEDGTCGRAAVNLFRAGDALTVECLPLDGPVEAKALRVEFFIRLREEADVHTAGALKALVDGDAQKALTYFDMRGV